ncbi:RusA family crossover junction endodeoxyribonuclease [Faecousia sp.]|uniref:RusA family crossover junction endodeoxyribonuclease n=1 Tax=Faecousia sp. TaxID=2952921 RepID=UPI003AB642BD
MSFVVFSVPGEPVAKGRPRFLRSGAAYTPAKTKNYEKLVRLEYARQAREYQFPPNVPLAIRVEAYLAIPKSASRKRRESMELGLLRPLKRPDADNILKSVTDALNGVAYRDDSQLVYEAVGKYYSSRPRIEVALWER